MNNDDNTSSTTNNSPRGSPETTLPEFVYIVEKYDCYNKTSHAGVFATRQLAEEAVQTMLRGETTDQHAFIYEARMNASGIRLISRHKGTAKPENPWE
ncbi:hypothetical protein psal_cds_610 [Pandoravirus salinus]|uniref:Uncharacterized protein n=1 Tax=Pandoravirus salinus TaxID=1349410 RepID=S4W237_9VIRU|nr:hypothetical protein psal_cds_610 [Pandoravirus salinus]AGO84487.1 hypothetical protein psal_cds_610 [Pandoravirus salinus]